MLSIIFKTLSKPPWLNAFLPANAKAIISKPARSPALLALKPHKRASAWLRLDSAFVFTCTKLAAVLGRVFLKRSSASSSFKTLIVSASATSSSALVFLRSSHSDFLLSHSSLRLAKNLVSSARAASVSESSSLSCTIFTPSSPTCPVFSSTAAESAATSLLLAARTSSYDFTAASSAAVMSARFFSMLSPSSLRMPVISPDFGA
mmetsp:Transcript_86826/g.202074  ORF Transcript_86826/g.202074 Transcript_86826/m.202074 type:complete len:205 (-) Transcript_86826:680-1294(-)